MSSQCLGHFKRGDVLIVLSNSGTTRECVACCGAVRRRLEHEPEGSAAQLESSIVGIFSDARDGQQVALSADHISHFCDHRLAYDLVEPDLLGDRCPTSSIVVQEALVNCLIESVVGQSCFTEREFLLNHPA
jgi:DNA-binding MurR/RpiR family transcriptional regulator